MGENITGKNTKTTTLSDIIQLARKKIIDTNTEKCIKSSDSRRIIIICLLFIYCFDDTFSSKDTRLYNLLKTFCLENKEYIIPRYCHDLDLSESIEALNKIKATPNWKEYLCYALEALEYNTDEYFSVSLNRGVRVANSIKKNRGIYYTPDDVVDFMVSHCLDGVFRTDTIPKILDCSCGSGVFLLASQKILDSKFNFKHDIEISLNLLRSSIWGIDISPSAIDSSIFTFIKYYIDCFNINPTKIGFIWDTLYRCFIIGDSTDLGTILSNNTHFPMKYDCIIGNPPYVTLGKNGNLFIPFVNFLMDYTSEKSFSALILPLSICYSKGKDFLFLRRRIIQDCATWEFYNFDRSPDSLFGDQVKTRNTIVFRYSGIQNKSLFSTKLQRWTSEKRISVFKSNSLCDISDLNIASCIPKISNSELKPLYSALSENKDCILDSLSRNGDESTLLMINGTAYNWLCVYDHIPPSTNENGELYLSTTSKVYYAPDKASRNFYLALLSNRIAYWFWTTIGDGFHVNSSFLSNYRISRKNFTDEQFQVLSNLGEKYSISIKQHPTVSFNARKKIINYSHWESIDTVKQIENIILQALNIPNDRGDIIANWYKKHVQCGRKTEIKE